MHKHTLEQLNDSKYLSKEQKAIIAKLDAFNGTLEDEKAVYEQLYKNVEISCTVTYKDKTKETKKIKITPKIGKISDLDSDGLNSGEKNPKADCKIVYTVYSIKQREPQFMRVEIQSMKN